MEPEIFFIRYAFPCSKILCTVQEEITTKEFEKLKDSAINQNKLEREFLEKVFFRAFNRINKIAKELKKDKWDMKVLREYFVIRHNKTVEESDYPESFKDMCKVYVAKVIGEEENGEIIVEYKKKKRRVKKDYLKDLKIGDKVTIHWKYAIEKI